MHLTLSQNFGGRKGYGSVHDIYRLQNIITSMQKLWRGNKNHLLASYSGFLLMSLHIGLHWNAMMGMMRNKYSRKTGWTHRGAQIIAIAFSI